MKKIILSLALLFLGACSPKGEDPADIQKYERTFFDTFDTIVSYVEYTDSEENFNANADYVEEEFNRLHKLYNTYESYQGLTNIRDVNNQAGQGPVKVEDDLVDLVNFSIDGYESISPKLNIAMGSVLEIWQTYRDQASENPDQAKLPPMEDLKAAQAHTNIGDIKVDEDKGTIEILDPDLRINLGATAKGYATELVADGLEKRGVKSAIISAGGNVKTLGSPLDGREAWGIGIQNPDNALGTSSEQLKESLFIPGTQSVVTSGTYQRFYQVNGETYHHIIDPDTLMPGAYYKSLSVMTEDSALADFLSTAAFLLPLDESKALLEAQGAQGLWIMPDNSMEYTQGMEDYMSSLK